MEDQLWEPGTAETVASAGFSWWGLMGTIVVFIAILVVVLFIIRRLNGSTMRGMNAPWARVLDRQVLGAQQSLYLVEIAGKLQVLAATDHHVTVIQEIDDPEAAAEILDEIANRPAEKTEGFVAKNMNLLFGNRRKKSFATELDRLLEEVQK